MQGVRSTVRANEHHTEVGDRLRRPGTGRELVARDQVDRRRVSTSGGWAPDGKSGLDARPGFALRVRPLGGPPRARSTYDWLRCQVGVRQLSLRIRIIPRSPQPWGHLASLPKR
jgi:hypothetical protein